VCIRQWDFSETSQTVSLLTHEYGLIRCIAKGSKREKAAFSGGLEIATMGHMVAIVKPSADLAILTAWDLLEPMHLIRGSLSRFHACMFTIDLIPRMINDHDPHPRVYDALVHTLGAIGSPERCMSKSQTHAYLAWYQWQLLVHTGAKPELMGDVCSGDALDEDASVYGFCPQLGGLTADPRHGASDTQDQRASGLSDIWRVRRSTVDLLRQLRSGADPDEMCEIPAAQLERVGGLLASYIRFVIGSPIPSSHWMYPQI